MKKIATFVMVLSLISPFYVHAEETEIINLYVSQNGSDNADGGINSPLKTLDGAKSKVREYKNVKKDIVVNFYGGEYPVTKTTVFTNEDSAASGKRITYKAYNDEEVTFLGSVRLDEELFEPIAENDPIRGRIKNEVRKKIGCMDLKKAGITDLDEYIPPDGFKETVVSMPKLYMDDVEQELSKWPNVGYSTVSSVIDGGALKKNNDYSGRPVVMGYTEEAPNNWTEAKGAIIEGYFRYEYACERLFIDKVDVTEKTITTKGSTTYGVASGARWRALNLLEELDLPGEYYIDMDKMKLYFYPPYGVGGKDVELSVLSDTMISAQNLNNVTFSGITFKNSRARVGDFSDCNGIQFKNCNFKNIAHQGLRMMNVYDTEVDGCSFENMGGYCIQIEGGDRTTLTPGNNHITNNTFYNMGLETKTYAGAVYATGVGTYIEHNVMHEAPHLAICFYGNDHKIRYNEIYNVVKETSDSSAIYCGKDYTMRGNEISYNYLHDIALGVEHAGIYAAAIYLDDQWSGALIHHNIFENVNMGVLVNSGRDNVVEANIFSNCKNSIRVTNRGEAAGRSYVIPGGEVYKRLMAIDYKNPPYSTKYPELAALQYDLDNLGSPKDNTVRNNLVYKSGALDIAESAVKYAKDISNNLQTDENPGFADENSRDFFLTEGCVALTQIPTLCEIDAKSAGIDGNAYRLSISDFRPVSPRNGATDVDWSSQFFMWDKAENADYYEFVLAEDAELKNVVCREKVRYNYYQSSELEKGKQYYWQVRAKNYSCNYAEEKVSAKFFFKTYDGEYLDTSVLDKNIQSAEAFVSEITEGDEISQYPAGSRDKLRGRITECKNAKRKSGATQKDIDLANSRLENIITEIRYSVNYGYVPISDFTAWDWSGNAQVNYSHEQIKASNGVTSYKDEYTGREVLCFDISFDKLSADKWGGIALKQDISDDYVYQVSKGSAYLVKISGDSLELVRYKAGISKTLVSVLNEFIRDTEKHSVQIGALNVKEGVRLIMYIDGEYIFDYTDKNGAIVKSGSFTVYDVGAGIAISKTEVLPDEKFDITKEFQYPDPVEITDIFASYDAWSTESTVWTSGNLGFDNNILSVNGTNFYTKNSIAADSTLKFRAKFNLGESWQGIALRNQNPTLKPWKADGYLICLKPKSIELQRYDDGKQEYVAILKNEYMASGEWHDYEITMQKASKGMRFILKIDENVLIDSVDENPIMLAGHLGFYDLSGLGIEVQEVK